MLQLTKLLRPIPFQNSIKCSVHYLFVDHRVIGQVTKCHDHGRREATISFIHIRVCFYLYIFAVPDS